MKAFSLSLFTVLSLPVFGYATMNESSSFIDLNEVAGGRTVQSPATAIDLSDSFGIPTRTSSRRRQAREIPVCSELNVPRPRGLADGEAYTTGLFGVYGEKISSPGDPEGRRNPDYDPYARDYHNSEWLYGQCLLDAQKNLLKLRAPGVPELAIEEFLIESGRVNPEVQQNVTVEGICEIARDISSEHINDELSAFIAQSSDIMEALGDELMRLRMEDAVRITTREIDFCQRKEKQRHCEAFVASEVVYDGNQPIGEGWRVAEVFENEATGFYAELQVKDGFPQEVMLVSRGSELESNDWLNNLTFAFEQLYDSERGGDPNRVNYENVMQALIPYIASGAEVTFAGHSLGGALSQGLSFIAERIIEESPQLDNRLRNNIRTVTFSSFGGGPLIEAINQKLPRDQRARDVPALRAEMGPESFRGTHYLSEGDAVTSNEVAYFMTGQTRMMRSHEPNCNPIECHSHRNIKSWLGQNQRDFARAYPATDIDANYRQRTFQTGVMQIGNSILRGLRNRDVEQPPIDPRSFEIPNVPSPFPPEGLESGGQLMVMI